MRNNPSCRTGLRMLACCLCALGLVLGLLLAPLAVKAASLDEPPRPAFALAYVPLDAPGRLDQARAAGLVPFDRVRGPGGEFLLAGVSLAPGQPIPDVGFSLRILDPDTDGKTYYLATAPPRGRPLEWAAFGTVLYEDATWALLRTSPASAERLAEQGAELAQISLAPAVVEPAPAGLDASVTSITPDPRVQGMLNQVTSAAVQSYDAQLSGETAVTIGSAPYTIMTRHTASGTPIDKATQYVGERLAASGYAVEYQPWSASGYTNRNVIGQRTGTSRPNDIYVIGAHLDDMPGSGSAPGADDNASGSSAVLLAADILSQYSWDCTLRFAFWTGEEQGLLGSAAYAARSKSNGETIQGYLNLDMIAYNNVSPRALDLFWKSTVPGSKAIADLFVDVVSAYGLDLVPYEYDTVSYTIGNYSDNRSFWNQGYPALLAIEDYYGDFTPYYHQPTDRLSTLDMGYMTAMTEAALGTFVHMSGCLSQPTPVTVRGLAATPQASWYGWAIVALLAGAIAWFVLERRRRRVQAR